MDRFLDNPLTLLLQRRRDQDTLNYVLLATALVCLAGGLFFGWMLGALPGLGATGCLLMLLPFIQAQGDSTALVSFLQGGRLDELRQTRLSVWEILDGITIHTLRRLHRPGLVLGLLGIALTWALAPLDTARPFKLGLACAWFPAFLMAGWALSYFSLLLAIPSETVLTCLGLVLVPPLLAFPRALVLFGGHQEVRAALAALTGTVWLAALSRLLAGRAFQRTGTAAPVAPAPSQARRTPTRSPWPRPWTDNPIVVRECAREAGRGGDGGLYLLTQYGLVAALVYLLPLGALTLGAVEFLSVPGYWYLVLATLYFLQPTRAATRISGAIAEERDKKTLECLAVTPLGRDEFIEGWAQVGRRARLTETALALPGVLYWMNSFGLSTGWVWLLLPLTLLNIYAGSYLGLALSLWASSRRHAVGDMAVFVYLLLGAVMALGLNGHLWLGAALVAAMGGLAWVAGRRLARYWLS